MSTQQSALCERVREHLLAPVGNDDVADTDVSAHLGECSSCAALSAELGAMMAGAHEMLEEELPRPLEDQVLRNLRPAIAEKAASLRSSEAGSPRRHRRAQWALWAGLGALGAAAAAWLLVVVIPGQSENVPASLHTSATQVTTAWVASRGDVRVVTKGGARDTTPQASARLRAGDTVTGAEGSRFLVAIAEERVAGLTETTLVLESLAPGQTRLSLHRGMVVAEVTPTPAAPKQFVVHFPGGEVQVRGTLFAVRTTEQTTDVSVVRGRVVVLLASGQQESVEAGTSLHMEDGRFSSRAVTRAQFEEMDVALDPRRWDLPTAVDSPRAPPLSPRTARPGAAPNDIRALVAAGDCLGAEQVTKRATKRTSRAERAQSLVEVANCYYDKDDLVAAWRIYADVARTLPDTAAGENAAYESGRMALLLGKPEKATKAFRAYLKAAPSGALAAEARFRLCTLDADAQRADAAITCLRGYRQKHPGGMRTAETYFLEATLLRTAKKDCPAALTAYDAYLEKPGEYAEQARGWQRWCRDQLAK